MWWVYIVYVTFVFSSFCDKKVAATTAATMICTSYQITIFSNAYIQIRMLFRKGGRCPFFSTFFPHFHSLQILTYVLTNVIITAHVMTCWVIIPVIVSPAIQAKIVIRVSETENWTKLLFKKTCYALFKVWYELPRFSIFDGLHVE